MLHRKKGFTQLQRIGYLPFTRRFRRWEQTKPRT